MKVCGNNGNSQLKEESNNISSYKSPCISPPCDFHIEIPSLLSYSICCGHSVWITNEGKAYAIGSNERWQITGSISKKVHRKEISISLEDSKKRKCQFISTVCGRNYTLYLVTFPPDDSNHLYYSHSSHKSSTPLFRSINGHNPKYLFGGYQTAAAIDSEGGLIVITENSIERAILPSLEKSVSVACCDSFVIVSGSNGGVFEASLVHMKTNSSSVLSFARIPELEGKDVVQVSGTFNHALALCRDGRVFARGSNFCGQLGLGKAKRAVGEFTEIEALSAMLIRQVSAGVGHSLFVNDDGRMFACGSNRYGQLMTDKKPSSSCVFLPVEAAVEGHATFCIAGNGISAVFVDCEAPMNTPNTPVRQCDADENALKMERLEKEIAFLREQNARLIEESELRQLEVSRLIEENAILKETNEKLQNQTKQEKCQKTSPSKMSEMAQHGHASTEFTRHSSFEILDAAAINSLERRELLGSGGSGRVFKVSKRIDFALKEMDVTHATHEQLRRFIGEYEIMSIFNHPNILRTHGLFTSDATTPPSILLELCPMSLDKAVRNGYLSNVSIVFSIFQIAEGMRHVHAQGVIHRDLKPSNILLDESGTVKIGDFGISKLMTAGESSTSMTGGVGTQKFMAPEVINEEKYDERVDVYSFGVVLFFILNQGYLSQIKIGDIFMGKVAEIPSRFTSFAKELVSRCMSVDKNERPRFNEICTLIDEHSNEIVKLSNEEESEVKMLIEEHKKKISYYCE